MRQEAINEVWGPLDRQAVKGVLEGGPESLFATITACVGPWRGAHLYGFVSANGDVEFRGAFVVPGRDLLRMHSPKETLSVERVKAGIELDWVAHAER